MEHASVSQREASTGRGALLVFEFFDDQGRVVSAEAERVVHRDTHVLIPRDQGRVIKVALWVGIFEIDRWRDLVVANGHRADS